MNPTTAKRSKLHSYFNDFISNRTFFVRAFSAGAISQFFIFFLQIVRSKFAAITVGTEGVGLWGATQAITNSLSSVTTFGVASGVPVLAAERWDPQDFRPILRGIACSSVLTFGGSLVVGLIASPFSSSLAMLILGSRDYWWIILAALFANPFLNCGIVLSSHLQGMAQLRSQTLLWLVGHGFLTVLCIVGILAFGSVGLAIAWVTYGFFSFTFSIFFLHRSVGTGAIVTLATEVRTLKLESVRSYFLELLPYVNSSLATSLLIAISSLAIRAVVLERFGIGLLGVFVSAVGISAALSTLFQSVFGTYAVPHLSNFKQDHGEFVYESNKAAKLIFLFSLPCLFIVSVFSPSIVQLLFSSDFIEASPVVQIYIAGELLQLLLWNFVIYFNLTKSPKTITIAKFSEIVVFVAFAFYLIPTLGLNGVGLAYILGGLSGLAVYIMICRRLVIKLFRLQDILGWAAGFGCLLANWHSSLSLSIVFMTIAMALSSYWAFQAWFRENSGGSKIGTS
ncbi:MAG: oligosaccharide flippase family protein [Pyrinomonadaceae bacterium]|nr:oligosaccharide flippase family protein [Pyrinomonadaceae bacterium]